MPAITPEKRLDSVPTLDTEVALAIRIIRKRCVPGALFQWLATPEKIGDCSDSMVDSAVTKSLNEIFAPLIIDARDWEKKEARYAARWIGAACVNVARNARQLDFGISTRLLSASLLPIYRSLASGELHEGLKQTRLRMSEVLCLVALVQEIGEDLVQLLDSGNRKMAAPSLIVNQQFGIDLTNIAATVLQFVSKFDTDSSTFDAESTETLRKLRLQGSLSSVEEWASPELLWGLSGELISKSSELVLPRSWVPVPVPWASISDHWHTLAHLLSASSAITRAANDATAGELDHASPVTQAKQTLANVSPESQDARESLTQAASTSTARDTRSESPSLASNENSDSEESVVAKPTAAQEAYVLPPLPKVLIAEIRSHNDPAFVNVVRRQIAKCRADSRAISLVSIMVLPEDQNDHHEVRENGLTLWQQKLVNWLADHPQIIEPYAFLTSEGELILCVLDIERNEATSLIRHGLIEVLTGKHVEDSSAVLAKVVVPARYHAGIASTSSPGAAFTPEQLIEPAVRCLSAATRQGKASIKSIEVY